MSVQRNMTKPGVRRLIILAACLAQMALGPASVLAGSISQATPNPFDFVGVYRIEGVTHEWQVARQFTVYLNTDFSASVEWATLFNDTQVNNSLRGTWRLVVDFVKLTMTEQDGQIYDEPVIIDLFYTDGFITRVVVNGETSGPMTYRFTLGSGDTHPTVRRLHQLLAGIPSLGFRDPGPSGAVYDEDTRKAVLAFQQSQGLLPSGIVDAATWLALHDPQPPGAVLTSTPPPTYLPPPGSTPEPAIVPTRALPTPAPTEALPTNTPAPVATATAPAPQPTACSPAGTINDLARLRSGPGTNFDALAMMPAGSPVEVTARNPEGDWYQIVFNGTPGWVFGSLINTACVDNLREVIVPTPTPAPAPPVSQPGSQPPPPAAGDKVLYFTFDDGPSSAWTAAIVEILSKYGARATFFEIGQQVAPLQSIAQHVLAQGHTLANHSWNHASLAGMNDADFNDQIMQTDKALSDAGAFQNASQKCMRPPYGATDGSTQSRLDALGYRMMLWQLDTNDWRLPGADQIVRYVLDNAYSGAIVLMHDGGGNRSQSAAALEVILQTLSQQGWRFELACP